MKKLLWTLGSYLALSVAAYGQDLDWKLLYAAKTGNTVEVQELLGAGANADARDKNGWTSLMWAVCFSRPQIVLALLEKGADVNAKGKDGVTALISAASKNNADIVRALLEKGAQVNAKDNDGWTPLFWAAFSGSSEIVRALLAKGADVKARDSFGKTALMTASLRGQADTVLTLLDHGADVNARGLDGRTALIVAANFGRTDAVRVLVEKGADRSARDEQGDTAIALAEEYNYSPIVALLSVPSEPPQNASAKNTTMSAPAVSLSSSLPSAVAVLVAEPATASSVPGAVSVQPTKPAAAPSGTSQGLTKKLLDAAEAGDSSEVLSLLREGADVNAKGSYGHTALMGAAARGYTDTVCALLERGTNVNAKGETGRTALMEAAFEGYTDTVRALLERGANVNAIDNEGWTALFWAAFSRRTDTVRLLLEKGADANAKNKHDDTALIRAAYGGDSDTVSVLLEKGADVNAKDDMGRTALIEAAREGHLRTVRTLLEKGADVHVKDRDGATALSEAEKQNYSEIHTLLKNPPGILQDKTATKTATRIQDAPPAVASNSAPVVAGAQGLPKKAQMQAFYRLGLNMQQVEDLWPHAGSMAARWASDIQQSLITVDAPGELIALAHRVNTHLRLSPNEQNGPALRLVRDLRARLDGFCQAQTEQKFFYAAGGFTYTLTLLGEDVENPNSADGSAEDARLRTLPLAHALAAECSAIAGCKEHTLPYFLAAATVLKKSPLAFADGAVLSKISGDIEKALSGNAP